MAIPWPSPAYKAIHKADQVVWLEIHQPQCPRPPIPALRGRAALRFVPGYREIELSRPISQTSTGQAGTGSVNPPAPDRQERANRPQQAGRNRQPGRVQVLLEEMKINQLGMLTLKAGRDLKAAARSPLGEDKHLRGDSKTVGPTPLQDRWSLRENSSLLRHDRSAHLRRIRDRRENHSLNLCLIVRPTV